MVVYRTRASATGGEPKLAGCRKADIRPCGPLGVSLTALESGHGEGEMFWPPSLPEERKKIRPAVGPIDLPVETRR